LARNHAFVDGNKRIAFLAMVTFLGLNDVDFVVPEANAVAMMLALAAGEVDEEGLARWIGDNWPKETKAP
jgi:death-on-curing protein